jgi:glutamate dehydrogenase (NAD(P)+)
VTRRYTSEIGIIIGPTKDIPAPDVNTNEQVMAWMMDTYSMNEGSTATGVVTGKPVDLGGSLGRKRSHRARRVHRGRRSRQTHRTGHAGARVAVQGLGNVGGVAAKLFAEGGRPHRVRAGPWRHRLPRAGAGRARPAGARGQHGSVAGFAQAEAVIDNRCLLGRALRHPDPRRAGTTDHRTQCPPHPARLVIEGANGPTTPQADDILHDRGILVVPDVIANAGGVTVSYFEWVQDFSSFFWSEDEINERLVRIMKGAFAAVWQVADSTKVSLRTATFIVACQRILHARDLRGLYP